MITGIELDIHPNETIVFEENLFPEFELVIGSVHVLNTLQKNKIPKLIIEEFKKLT